MEDVGQNQVVEVAAVARHQHDRMLLHRVDDPLETDDLEPREDTLPEPVEDRLEDPEVEAVEVRGHLAEVAARLSPHPGAGHAALRGDAAYETHHLRVAQHLPPDQASRQQRRSPHQTLLAVEEDLEGAGQPADEPVLAFPRVLLDEVPEDDLTPERQLRLLGVPEVVEQPFGLARGILHAVEEGREARFLSAETLPPEDRHRDEEHGLLDRLAGAQQLVQVLGAEPSRGELAAPAPGHRLAPHEEENGLAARHERRARRVHGGARAPSLPEEPHENLAQGSEPDGRDPRCEARERQPLAEQHRIHQQVVEERPVAHHVDDRALSRELLEMLHGSGPQLHTAEEEVNQETSEESEALEHARGLLGNREGLRASWRRDGRFGELRHQR